MATPKTDQPQPPEQLPASDKLKENIKLDTTEQKLEELKKDVNFDTTPVSEETIDKALHEYNDARKATREALTALINKFNALKDTLDDTTYQDYVTQLEALKREYEGLETPVQLQKDEVQGKKAKRAEKREKFFNEEQRTKIQQLLNQELGIQGRNDPRRLAHMCHDFTAWGGDDVVLDLRQKIKQHMESTNPSFQKAQQFIDIAKAYIHLMVMNDRDIFANSYDTEKIKGSAYTFDNMDQIAQKITTDMEDTLRGQKGKTIPNYANNAITAIIGWTHKDTEQIYADELIAIKDNKLKTIPKDATEEDQKAYTNYVCATWIYNIASAHNGENDNTFKYLSDKNIEDIKNMKIDDFNDWKNRN